MKMVICIVSDKDAPLLVEELVQKGYRTTKLASTGGFLKKGNTTLLMGVEEEQVDDVVATIGRICRSRQEIVAPISPMPGPVESYVPLPVEVTVGGATIFVLDVARHIKV